MWFSLPFFCLIASSIESCLDDVPQDAVASRDRLGGTWEAIRGDADGKAVPEERLRGFKMVFEGDKLTWDRPSGAKEEFVFKINPSKEPNEIDLTCITGKSKGLVTLAIYRLEKDTLTVCLPTPGAKERPSKVDARKLGLSVLTFKRVER